MTVFLCSYWSWVDFVSHFWLATNDNIGKLAKSGRSYTQILDMVADSVRWFVMEVYLQPPLARKSGENQRASLFALWFVLRQPFFVEKIMALVMLVNHHRRKVI